ncbi:MAG: hypothetical protein J6X60_08760 [Ruminiclostridium sp.]|nr:hypothetical protein [Ruminiclostridium sp.]
MRHIIIRFLCGVIFVISAIVMLVKGEFLSSAFSAVMAVCFILSGTALIRKAGKH